MHPNIQNTRHPRRIAEPLLWLIGGAGLALYAWLGFRRYFPPFSITIHLTVLLLLTLWGAWNIHRRRGIARTPLTLPIVVFAGSALLSTYFSVDYRRSYDALLITITMLLTFFVVCDMLLAGVQPRFFIDIIITCTTILMLIGMWHLASHYITWHALNTTKYPTFLIEYRLFGVTDHPNFLAAIINMALPFAIVALARSATTLARVAWASWLLLYVVILYVTHSRGGTVAAASIVFITGVWLLSNYGIPRMNTVRSWFMNTRRIWLAYALYIGLFVLLMWGQSIVTLLQHDTQPVTSAFTTNDGSSSLGNALQSGRMAFWRIAWDNFLVHPLLGSGQFTYGRAFIKASSSVRYWMPSYSHNLFIEVLSTQGIVGLTVLLWLIATAKMMLLRGWWIHRATPITQPLWHNQHLIVATSAAVSGNMVHSLVDVPGIVPVNHIILMTIAACGIYATNRVHSAPQSSQLARAMYGVLLVPIILAVILLRYAAAQDALLTGMLAAMHNDWHAAAESLDDAVATDPNFLFYGGQRAYAYSVLAAPVGGDDVPAARDTALAAYAQSLAREPAYMPHYLNTIALLQEAGNITQADTLLEKAHTLSQARFWALPHLLLAERYATHGDIVGAAALYKQAVQSEPHAAEMAVCRQSVSCRTAMLTITSELSTTIQQVHREAQALLAQGKPAEALAVLERIPISSAATQPWLDRADAYLAVAQHDEANYALQVADTLRSVGLHTNTAAHAARTHAAYALAHGTPLEAIDALEQAVRPHITMEGYDYSVYRRVGLPGLLQPRLELLQQTADHLAIYRQLEALYRQQNRPEDATWAHTYATALEPLLALNTGES